MNEIWDMMRKTAVTYGVQIIGSIIILIVGRWLARLLTRWILKLMAKTHVDETLTSFLSNILFYLFFSVVIIAALGNLGIPTTSVVAILGAATLAIGFALQDSLSNLAAGVMIILLRPFRIGDLVEINDTLGHVTQMQIFHTLLTTLDNKSVFLPNGDIMSNKIINYSKKEIIRLDLVYGIGYDDDLLKAKRLLENILHENEFVLPEPAPAVSVLELADSSVNFAVWPYVKVEHMVPAKLSITEQVKLRFDAENVSIPYPQQAVRLYQCQ